MSEVGHVPLDVKNGVGVTVLSETVPRKFFLVPESGNSNIPLSSALMYK
jgi:hypothetical protein